MNKNLFTLLISFTIIFTSKAEEISISKAKEVAKTQVQLIKPNLSRSSANLSLAYTKHYQKANNQQLKPALYVFNIGQNEGFVIVAGDDISSPVLGYSSNGSFDGENLNNVPFALRKLIDSYKEEIQFGVDNNFNREYTDLWDQMETGTLSNHARSSSVAPLTTTLWNQRGFYNDSCPSSTDAPDVPTGCVAVAFTQVMKYYNHPAQGMGTHSYNLPAFGTLSANFGATTYDWANMPNELDASSTASQKAEVAKLMSHAGISINMGYTGTGSSAYTYKVATALENNFRYKTSLHEIKKRWHGSSWVQTLKDELDAARVVLYSGHSSNPDGGHAFVLDGYDNQNKFHVNWGWGGYLNGYFELNNMQTQLSSGNYNWINNNGAIIGIEPDVSDVMNFDVASQFNQVTPIESGSSFTVTIDMKNNSFNSFNSEFRLTLLDQGYNIISKLDSIGSTSFSPNQTKTLSFSHSGSDIFPGTSILAIEYKENGNWVYCDGILAYENFEPITIGGGHPDVKLSSSIIANPDPIEYDFSFDITATLQNLGTMDYSGVVSADIYDINHNWVGEIGNLNVTILAGGSETVTFTAAPSFYSYYDVDPGTYKIAIWTNFNGWELAGATGFNTNLLTVDILGEEFASSPIDPYENNDDWNSPYTYFLTSSDFSGSNEITVTTTGSNIHDLGNNDFYKIDLPQGDRYSVTATIHDNYNSNFTTDVLIKSRNNVTGFEDGSYFDHQMNYEHILENGGSVTFKVIPYFEYSVGTYEIDFKIYKGADAGLQENIFANSVEVYPNPTKDIANIAFNQKLHSDVTIEVQTLEGKLIESFNFSKPSKVSINTSNYNSGTYLLVIKSDDSSTIKKLNIIK